MSATNITAATTRAEKAKAKSLSYYYLVSATHYVHIKVVKEERLFNNSRPRDQPQPGGGVVIRRWLRAEVHPLPRTPYEKLQQYLYGDLEPEMLSRVDYAKAMKLPQWPLALTDLAGVENADEKLYQSNAFRPFAGVFYIHLTMSEWLKMRAGECGIEDHIMFGTPAARLSKRD